MERKMTLHPHRIPIKTPPHAKFPHFQNVKNGQKIFRLFFFRSFKFWYLFYLFQARFITVENYTFSIPSGSIFCETESTDCQSSWDNRPGLHSHMQLPEVWDHTTFSTRRTIKPCSKLLLAELHDCKRKQFWLDVNAARWRHLVHFT